MKVAVPRAFSMRVAAPHDEAVQVGRAADRVGVGVRLVADATERDAQHSGSSGGARRRGVFRTRTLTSPP